MPINYFNYNILIYICRYLKSLRDIHSGQNECRVVMKMERKDHNLSSKLSLTVTNLFNHISTLEFIAFEVFVYVNGQDRHLVEVLKVCPVSQKGESVM